MSYIRSTPHHWSNFLKPISNQVTPRLINRLWHPSAPRMKHSLSDWHPNQCLHLHLLPNSSPHHSLCACSLTQCHTPSLRAFDYGRSFPISAHVGCSLVPSLLCVKARTLWNQKSSTFTSLLYLSLVMWPWARTSLPLGLSFLVCKTGILTVPSSESDGGGSRKYYV